MNSNDEMVRKSLEQSRATLERTRHLCVSEPQVPEPEPYVIEPVHKGWCMPEPEPEPRPYRLDTNLTAHVEQRCAFIEQRCAWLEEKMAETFPPIARWMENVNKEWNVLKKRTETAEKGLEELEKRFAEAQRKTALDLRAVELAWQSDLMSLRETRHKENVDGKQSNSRAGAR